MCVCACARACVRACVRARVRVCVCVCASLESGGCLGQAHLVDELAHVLNFQSSHANCQQLWYDLMLATTLQFL